MAVDLDWLRSFVSIARTRSFSAAARECNITQPAFSRRIRGIENWLGVALIDRSTYPTTLTPTGRRFLEVAAEIDEQLTEFRREIAEAQPADRPRLVVAAQHSLAMTYLPALLERLHDDDDALFSVIHAENIHDCLQKLQAGNADVLFSYALPGAPLQPDGADFVSSAVGEDALLPVSAPDGARRPRHSLPGGAAPVPWLSYGPDAMLEHGVMQLVEQRRVRLRPLVRNPISEVLRRFAQSGLGLAWLPQSLVAEDLDGGRLVRAGDHTWVVPLEIRAYRLAKGSHPILDALWPTLTAP